MPNANSQIIGLSLSLCVSQIARGEVKESDVEKIIAATDAPSLLEFLAVLAQYSKIYWREFPIKASMIALRFYNSGKIDQPRTREEDVHFIGDGKWMDENQNTFHILSNGERQYSGAKLRAW